jgi:hypothetical protein
MVDSSSVNEILDPLNDRKIKSVPKPPRLPLQKDTLFR